MTAAASTIASKTHPKNQDKYLIDQNLGLFAVFDGMGGYEGGEVAAKIALSTIHRFLKENQKSKLSTKEQLVQALILATEKITSDGQRHNRPNQGTTATVVYIKDSKIFIANVGDSRFYAVDKEGKLTRLTEDHNLLSQMVKDGRITGEAALAIDQATSADNLSQRELPIFYDRYILTNALGAGFIETNIFESQTNFSNFKTLILTTDGLHDNLTDEQIRSLVAGSKSTKDAAHNLVNSAYWISQGNLLRSKPDDITAVVVII